MNLHEYAKSVARSVSGEGSETGTGSSHDAESEYETTFGARDGAPRQRKPDSPQGQRQKSKDASPPAVPGKPLPFASLISDHDRFTEDDRPKKVKSAHSDDDPFSAILSVREAGFSPSSTTGPPSQSDSSSHIRSSCTTSVVSSPKVKQVFPTTRSPTGSGSTLSRRISGSRNSKSGKKFESRLDRVEES